jgi:hypothetical protein
VANAGSGAVLSPSTKKEIALLVGLLFLGRNCVALGKRKPFE